MRSTLRGKMLNGSATWRVSALRTLTPRPTKCIMLVFWHTECNGAMVMTNCEGYEQGCGCEACRARLAQPLPAAGVALVRAAVACRGYEQGCTCDACSSRDCAESKHAEAARAAAEPRVSAPGTVLDGLTYQQADAFAWLAQACCNGTSYDEARARAECVRLGLKSLLERIK